MLLRPLLVPDGGRPDLGTVLPALSAALDGTGPPLLPVPVDAAAGEPARTPAAQRLLAAMRAGEPLERDGIALVVPTSGSGGELKGALLSAAALLASARTTVDRLGGPGAWLLALPLTHVAGLQVVVRSLLAGTVPEAVAPGDEAGFVAGTARLSGPRRYTALVPTQLARLLAAGAGTALSSYDAVLVGGGPAPQQLLERAREAGVAVVTTYGMTETCGGCVYDGRPLDGVDVQVVADGRIRVRGPVLFSGYRLREDLTAAALRDGELVTGDLGRFDGDGRLHVLGRVDDVVVTGGENVALSAVENALTEHAGVREAAALGVPDPEWGTRVVAVVVPEGAPPPTLAELRSWVAERAGRAAAPWELRLVTALPRTALGKLDRQVLGTLDRQGMGTLDQQAVGGADQRGLL